MSRTLKGSMIAAFLAALVAAPGCEDSGISAGKDYQMYLVALPPTVHVDPDDPTAPLTSRIVATIVTDTGVPKEGLLVFFGADGGTLSSNNQPVETDSNGNAFDTLTLDPGGPGDVTVVATSTALSDSVTVTNGACAANPAPVAEFPVPANPAAGNVGEIVSVNLSAATSSDTAPGLIVSYAWNCGNGTSGGTTASAVCEYTVTSTKQTYQITLTIKDNGLGGSGPTYACQKSSSVTHPVSIDVLPIP